MMEERHEGLLRVAWANLFGHAAPGDSCSWHVRVARLTPQASSLIRASRRTPHPSRLGFTLVEIVVVISLVLLLVGLTLSVSTVVIERSEIRQTENTMRLLDTALQEWEALADRQISWGAIGVPPGIVYDMDTATATDTPVFLITELLNTVARPAQAKSIIANIDPSFVHTYREGDYPSWITAPFEETAQDTIWAVDAPSTNSLGLAVLDAWEGPIRVIHPGRVADPGDPFFDSLVPDAVDQDGTIRTSYEMEFGVARNRRICFVSAGPDGKYGGLDPAMPGYDPQGAEDNIYSYKPAPPPSYP